MRWWGWGEEEHHADLPETAAEQLRTELELEDGARGARVALEDVRLPDHALPEELKAKLVETVTAAGVRDDREARVGHALGKSYPDLVRIRSGDGSSAPDAVVLPGSAEQVAAVLRACAEARVAVVPFGGGTSVVGGVEPLRRGFAGAISLDLSRMAEITDVDHRSLTARFGPGVFGPAGEAQLADQGLTLGHFPQSFEYSTVGGWLATRSAGQASTGYGRIDELVESVRLVTPSGELRTRDVPATAAGPSLRELAVGSEGVLGVICDSVLRVRPRPEEQRYEGWSFKSFAEGAEAFRVMEQEGASPDVARLSDEEETRLQLALASTGGRVERLGRSYLQARGHGSGCFAIVGFEGERDETERRRQRSAALLRAGGGLPLGRRPGEAWKRGRYAAPYLRDDLLDRAVMVETLETATTWSRLEALHEAVGEALRKALGDRGTPALVMCHVSHLYPSGASLYFTFLARQETGAELVQWQAAKTAASQAIAAAGATITHHHAVGRDHLPWMQAEVSPVGVAALRAVKKQLDPAGIMNPGKLIPD